MKIFIAFVFILTSLSVFADDDCSLNSTDVEKQKLFNRFQSLKVYGKIFETKSKSSVYRFGICKSLSSANRTAATQQQDGKTFVLGQLNSSKLIGGDNWMLLTYENGERFINVCDNQTRSAAFVFVCGSNTDVVKVVQENSKDNQICQYTFQIELSDFCPKIPAEEKKMSAFAILFIIVLCLVSIYLVGGFFFMRLKHGARGIEQIPNFTFWQNLGNKLADGCDFCCRCPFAGRRAGYFLDETRTDFRTDDEILAP